MVTAEAVLDKCNKKLLISNEKSLFETEFSIREQLKQCEYWGELPVTYSQYEYLCDALKEKREDKSATAFIKYLFDRYPACTVTTMVFFLIFEYREDFWGPWLERLGVDYSQQLTSVAGNKMIETLHLFRKDKYEDDGFKFITPLLCQAGVPDSNLDDLFYAITTSKGFDAHELLAEFKGWRAYQIKKPLARFIRLHENSALNLVVQVHDVMIEGDAGSEDSFERRAAAQYDSWKEVNLNKQGRFKGKGAYQENPHLILDDNRGLCMVLPEFILEDEYCTSIKWSIESSFLPMHTLICDVFNDGNSKHSLEKIIPVSAKTEYRVKVSDPEGTQGDTLLKDWTVNGIGEEGYLLFDNNGKKRTDGMFPYEGGSLLLEDSITDYSFENAIANETIMPNSEGVRFFDFHPTKTNALIRIGGTEPVILRLKKMIRASFSGGKYLFDDVDSGYNYPIFVTSPYVSMEIEDGVVDDSVSMVLRNYDTGFRRTIEAAAIETATVSLDEMVFDILDVFETKEYGRYSLKFYVKGQYRKEMEFAYIPEISFEESYLREWPNPRGAVEASGFRYKQTQKVAINFTSKVNDVAEQYRNEYWRRVTSRVPGEFIEGEIEIHSGVNSDGAEHSVTIPFRKRIRNIQWSYWAEDSNDLEVAYGTGRIESRDLKEVSWWLSASMKRPTENEYYYIVLRSTEGADLQKVAVKPNDKGKWHISIDTFLASIEGRKLPVHFFFRVEAATSSYEFPIIEIYETKILMGLKTGKKNERNESGEIVPTQVMMWLPGSEERDYDDLEVRSLSDDSMNTMPIVDVRKASLKDGTEVEYMAFDNLLPPGLYRVEYRKEDFFDFGEDLYKPPRLGIENTFFVKKKQMLRRIGEGTLRGIVAAISAAYKSEEDLEMLLYEADRHSYEGELTDSDLKCIIMLALYAFNERSGECETRILCLLELIRDRMAEKNKAELLGIIVDCDLRDEEKKKLILFFGLEYAVASEKSKEKVDAIMSIDTFIGIRSLLKCERSQWVFNSLASSLGLDIMKEMITTGDNGERIVAATYDMFGDANYFYNMFDWESVLNSRNYKPPKLDMKKKPEDELLFWSDGFINLMIKWYYKGNGVHKEEEAAAKALVGNIERISVSVSKVSDQSISDYFRKSFAREAESKGGFWPIISASAKAGMLFALIDFEMIRLPQSEIDSIKQFVDNMNVVFPELIKRDILMAELFLYLRRA